MRRQNAAAEGLKRQKPQRDENSSKVLPVFTPSSRGPSPIRRSCRTARLAALILRAAKSSSSRRTSAGDVPDPDPSLLERAPGDVHPFTSPGEIVCTLVSAGLKPGLQSKSTYSGARHDLAGARYPFADFRHSRDDRARLRHPVIRASQVRQSAGSTLLKGADSLAPRRL